MTAWVSSAHSDSARSDSKGVPVSLEHEPAEAVTLFGPQIDVARLFTEELAQHGEERGLIGPLELPRLWSRHILNCAVIAPVFTAGARVADVGSGAGLPGLILAIARPDVSWTLIEPMERRVHWLDEQVSLLGLENVEVVRARSEDVAPSPRFDYVTARAVSALKTLLPVTGHLLGAGGEFVFLKGANAPAEITAAAKQLKRLGIEDARVEIVGEGLLAEPSRVVRGTVTRAVAAR